jgi:hypothetical protein
MAPRIVNGLTVRPRKQTNPWLLGLLLLPDFVAIPVLVGLGLHRLLRYLAPKGNKLSATSALGQKRKSHSPVVHVRSSPDSDSPAANL